MYFMGFCLLSRGRVIVKKLDLARWREAVNTSWSLLTFAYFCSSSFSSRCNVLISVNNSGCLSLSLQELTSLQGVFLTIGPIVAGGMAKSTHFSAPVIRSW